MFEQEDFAELIHSALAHLYDHAYLQDHPLATSLATDVPADTRGQVLRRLLLQAIQELKPPQEAPPASPGWRHYQYLYLRYVEAKPVAEIAETLAVSERQTRRRHHDALEALARILGEKLQTSVPVGLSQTNFSGRSTVEGQTTQFDAELQRISTWGSSAPGDLVSIIDRAVAIVTPLAQKRDVSIAFRRPPLPTAVAGDQVILRQAVVCVLVQAIHTALNRRVEIAVLADTTHTRIAIQVENARHGEEQGKRTSASEEINEARRLLLTQQGTLAHGEQNGRSVVELTLRTAPRQTILVVDDNPDMRQLLRRYLRPSGYHVAEAGSGEDAVRLLGQIQPSGIILDVMMSGRDGWEVLQTIRGRQDTKDTPVIVCSVLRQEELALSLGATEFLAKPISQQSLLEALHRSGMLAG